MTPTAGIQPVSLGSWIPLEMPRGTIRAQGFRPSHPATAEFSRLGQSCAMESFQVRPASGVRVVAGEVTPQALIQTHFPQGASRVLRSASEPSSARRHIPRKEFVARSRNRRRIVKLEILNQLQRSS